MPTDPERTRRVALAQFEAGLAAETRGDLDLALASYRAAWTVFPGFVEAAANLAQLLNRHARHAEAEAVAREALPYAPEFVPLRGALASALLNSGRPAEALPECDFVLAREPGNVAAGGNRAVALVGLGRIAEAAMAYIDLAQHAPDDPTFRLNFAGLLSELGRAEEAEAMLGPAFDAAPAIAAGAWRTAGVARLSQSRYRDARAAFARSVALNPADPEAGSGEIFAANFDPDLDDAGAQSLRKAWAARHAEPLRAGWAPHDNDPAPARRLAVGYVSGDFREHSAAGVIEPILAAHDKAAVEIVCYSTNPRDDERTQLFKSVADRWRDVRLLDTQALATLVREDRIDILVDLSGHTGGNRLLAFARKPAPIQFTGLGDANGTGVSAIDFLFTDPVALPQAARNGFAERPIDLPNAQLFRAPEDGPAPSRGPRDHLVLGTFNRIAKLDDAVLRLWARLLGAPGRRLVLKDATLAEEGSRARLHDRLARCGIDPSKVEMLKATSRQANYADYARLDVALDPFPYGGGLTTLDALWMGVPLVTLRGRTIQGRLSASILTSIGRPDWIAETPAEYVSIIERLLADPAARDAARAGLRDAVRRSAVGDAAGYARAVEARYREVWTEWCVRAKRPNP
jgi:predicted O-linked N-acetylglucosamine transferase (SPINDLY family)